MKDEFDWFKWAGIKENDVDKLVAEARKEGVNFFDGDSPQEIFNRLLAVKSYKSNTKFMLFNVAIATISCIAAVVSVAYAV